MTSPFLESLFGSLGETEIGDAGEVLLGAVVAVGLEQLERAQDAELVGEMRAGLVLSAIAAREREELDGDSVAARFEREQAAVFVVGVRVNVHETRGGAQLGEHLLDAGAARVHGERLVGLLREGSGREQREGKESAHRLIRVQSRPIRCKSISRGYSLDGLWRRMRATADRSMLASLPVRAEALTYPSHFLLGMPSVVFASSLIRSRRANGCDCLEDPSSSAAADSSG
jgi:hypothetical protein